MTLDDRLFDYVFQPFQDWWQKLTGYTCFWLAKWCAVGVFVWHFLADMVGLQDGEVSFVFLVVWNVLMLFFVAFAFLFCELVDKEFARGRGYANEERVGTVSAILRKCTVLIVYVAVAAFPLAFAIGGVRNLYILFSLIFLLAFLYFSACTPLPPQKSKVRRWVEAAKVWLQPAPEGGEVLPA